MAEEVTSNVEAMHDALYPPEGGLRTDMLEKVPKAMGHLQGTS